jgi:hypothetical protein
MALAWRVRFVRCHYDLAPRSAEQPRDVPIDRSEPLPDVEQQDDDLGLIDRDLGLSLDGGARFILGRVEVQAGRVDDSELSPTPLDDAKADPVSAPIGVDRLAPAEHAIEKGRLPDIGAADDRDDGARHDVN